MNLVKSPDSEVLSLNFYNLLSRFLLRPEDSEALISVTWGAVLCLNTFSERLFMNHIHILGEREPNVLYSAWWSSLPDKNLAETHR